MNDLAPASRELDSAGITSATPESLKGKGDEPSVLLARHVVEVLHRRLDVRVAHPFLDATDVGLGDHPVPNV